MSGVLSAALQRLLVVAAALALLGHGGVGIAPRLIAAAGPASTASTASASTPRPASRPAAESKPVAPSGTLRTVAALPAPSTGGDTAAGPSSALRVAPHLAARPVVRPPTRSHVLGVGGGASGRAPPAPAGT